jgi:hypothetical protein
MEFPAISNEGIPGRKSFPKNVHAHTKSRIEFIGLNALFKELHAISFDKLIARLFTSTKK